MHSLEITKVLQLLRQPQSSILPYVPAEHPEKRLQVELKMTKTGFNFPSSKAAGNTCWKIRQKWVKGHCHRKCSFHQYSFEVLFKVLWHHLQAIFSISQQYFCSETYPHYIGMRSFCHSLPIFKLWLHSLKNTEKNVLSLQTYSSFSSKFHILHLSPICN